MSNQISSKKKNTKHAPIAKKRHVEESSSSSDSSSSSSSEEEDLPSNSKRSSSKIDMHEYRKEIAKMFPSRHLSDKIKAGERSQVEWVAIPAIVLFIVAYIYIANEEIFKGIALITGHPINN